MENLFSKMIEGRTRKENRKEEKEGALVHTGRVAEEELMHKMLPQSPGQISSESTVPVQQCLRTFKEASTFSKSYFRRGGAE